MNYVSKFWGLISIYIFTPVYIKYLGVESYAIIGFYTLILGFIGFADAGMSSAVIREFSSNKSLSYKQNLLITIEKIYFAIGILITLSIWLAAPWISTSWLKSSSISVQDMVVDIRLIGFGVTLQLMSFLYYGALFGLNLQVKANVSQIIWNIAKPLGGVALFFLFAPSLLFFFTWQAFCNAIYLYALRSEVFKNIVPTYDYGNNERYKLSSEVVNYVVGMSLIAIISAVNTQIDKAVISSSFSLKDFGYYNLASTLAQLPVLVATPLTAVVFPLLAKYNSLNEKVLFKEIFFKYTFIVNMFIISVFITIFIFPKDIYAIWVGHNIEKSAYPNLIAITQTLSVGSSFLALQLLPYYLLLSKGLTKYVIIQGVVQIGIGVPLLFYCVKNLGITGAGIPWVVINSVSYIYLLIIIHSKIFEFSFWVYFREYALTPLIIGLVIASLEIMFQLSFPNLYTIVLLGIGSVISILLNFTFLNYRKKISLTSIKYHFDF